MSWTHSAGRGPGGKRPSRRGEIVEEAGRQFAAAGIAAVGPTEIANALGMTATAIRYHFPDVDELLHELFDPLLDRLEHVVAAHPNTTGDEELCAPLADYASALLDHQDIATLLDTDPTARNHPQFGGRLDQVSACAHAAVAGPDPTPERRLAASAALGSLWRPLKRYSGDELRDNIDALLDVALTGHDER